MSALHKSIVSLILIVSPAILAADTPQGTVVCWGYEVGYDDAPGKLKVLTIGGERVTNAIAVAAGDSHALALRSDGTLVGWGVNMDCQAVGYASTNSDRATGLVKIDGQVLSNVVAIAAGGNNSLALRRDGTVVGWGSHIVPTGLSNIASIATGYYYSMGVKKDGTVLSLGGGDVGSWSLAHPGFSESEYAEYAAIFLGLGNSRSIEGLSNAVVVGIGVDLAFGSMALKRDGTVVQISLENQLTGHQLLSNAIAISGGWDGLALKEDGTVVGWGTAGEVPPGLSNVVAISGGRRNNLALKRDGTLVMWGGFSPRDLAVPTGLRNVVAISVGQGFFMAITTSPP